MKDINKMLKLIDEEFLEYSIGDMVYSAVDSNIGRGRILNWRIFGADNCVEYLVTFGPGMASFLSPLELSKDKPINY